MYPTDDPTSRSLAHRGSPEQIGYKSNGSDQGTFKPGGLIKKVSTSRRLFAANVLNTPPQTITVTIEGSDLHLISYYTSEDIRSGKLKVSRRQHLPASYSHSMCSQRPSTRMDIMSLYMPPHIFRLTNFRVPPKVEIGPDGKPRLV